MQETTVICLYGRQIHVYNKLSIFKKSLFFYVNVEPMEIGNVYINQVIFSLGISILLLI